MLLQDPVELKSTLTIHKLELTIEKHQNEAKGELKHGKLNASSLVLMSYHLNAVLSVLNCFIPQGGGYDRMMKKPFLI